MSGDCETCHEHTLDCICSKPSKAKDYCSCCEYPELLHMLEPRIVEMEKKIAELEFNLGFHARLINEINYRANEACNTRTKDSLPEQIQH